MSSIVSEIQVMTGSRTHLLIEQAGVGIGVWAVRPILPATELLVAGILLEAAGANDLDELRRWVDIGRERGLRRPHTAP